MYTLLLVSLFFAANCFAMDKADNEKQQVIEGSLVLDPREQAWYNLDGQRDVARKLSIEVSPNEPMLFVTALQGDGSLRNEMYLPNFGEFPQTLPLSMLQGKKEGEKIEILVKDNVKIVLTCRQGLWCENALFQDYLAHAVRKFKKHPRVHLFGKDILLEKGIITKNDNDKYNHGPNGYKFEDASEK